MFYLDKVNDGSGNLQILDALPKSTCRVRIERQAYIFLVRVKVIDDEGNNVALGKTVTQSSTYDQGDASYALTENREEHSQTTNVPGTANLFNALYCE